jgi:hypothetical protein
MKEIMVSQNRRFLCNKDEKPFFWLADTAWELFHRCSEKETEYYLDVRKSQGFNVIQAVVLAECDGLHAPNSQGHTPLLGDDPARPNEYYFRHVDRVIEMAAERNLYIALLPTWGDKVHSGKWGIGPAVFNSDNSRIFGEYLGKRYRESSNILWVMGGDRPLDQYEPVWKAMAMGIEKGLEKRPFCTFHPSGGASSSMWLHDASWLDMNMLQSGHMHRDYNNWEMIEADYLRKPIKPVLDGEPCYEDHPINIFTREWKPEYGRFTDYDVRKQAYRSVFAGACGHTYGHHSIWQFWNMTREMINKPNPPWEEALFRPGATQMAHLKNLMLSRSYNDRIPAQEMILNQPSVPAPDEQIACEPVRAAHAMATRAEDGSWAMIYFPEANQKLELDLSDPENLQKSKMKGIWYDTRTGETHPAGELAREKVIITSPLGGPDWVLILDRIL